ncbi:MAG TPA: restriction endonuclease subunit S [Candidatus Atribacteria bacterium]|nr:restriction endonuclease subunit S [Candidatus Atribacteria bacterium]
MSFSNEVVLKDVSEYSKEKIDIGEISISNYVSTENLLPDIGGKALSSGLPSKGKATKYCKGDILISNIRPYFKKIWQADNEGGSSNDVLVLKAKRNIEGKFLYYNLACSAFFDYVMSGAKGTKMPRGDKNHILGYKLNLPPMQEQKAIAHILSTLDDKIEVNNQINKTLENMAQAIFKQWFVDFEFPNEDGEPYKSSGGEMVESELGMIPKGWEVKELGEIIDIIKQGTKPGEHLKDRKYNPIDTLPMKSIAINDFKPYEEAKSSLILFEKYDVLIGAMRVYFHRVNLAPYKGITRTTTFVLRSKRIQDVPYNLFLLNMDETIDYAERTSKGSTMPYAVWDNGMSNMLTAYSNKELRNNFFEIIQPMLETIMKRSAENEVLIKIRDSLLPKLMSGEIRVPLDEEGDLS